MLGEQPRIKILWYLIRIRSYKQAFGCLFWTDKKWFKSNKKED